MSKIESPKTTGNTNILQLDNNIMPTKISRVFDAFMVGLSFNRFEAERILHDHCLHSTVSKIERSYGVIISREWETVPGYLGAPTRVKRYFITLVERERYASIIRKK